jgi:hypothetical protein
MLLFGGKASKNEDSSKLLSKRVDVKPLSGSVLSDF